ncbi:hypothetical protein CW751_10385 [Brumimicrobium salinarum]|uniref:Uncharacterized protein n=1 Tax=Brumimicrobium salinarum TaxID=2058658 RepID=A0A2I0R0Z4_9FLAO|nr:hypothetical protein [Brumimicrobium salinarum]PKR80256.1 hypothetical protein CW751_10385 [Brumimicrobium salinarum]
MECSPKKIEKQHIAFLVLTSAKKDEKNKEVLIDNKFEFSDNPITCFNQLHQKRNEFKSLLLRAQSADELIVIIASWLTLEKKYAQTWSYVACSDNHLSVLQGKEPDPMEILAALKKVKSDNQIESIALLKDNYNNLPETIQKEVKRLTLLAKE